MEHTMSPTSPHPRRWWALAVLSLGLLVISLDNTILNVALPSLSDDLGATSSELQWIVDAYLLVFAGLLLTAGSLGDRFGRKRALTLGLFIFGAASAASAMAQTPAALIAGRAMMGIGGALIMPSTLSIVTATEGDRHLGRRCRHRRRDRPRGRRLARRERQLALGVPRQRAVRADRARRRTPADPGVARPEPVAARPDRRGHLDGRAGHAAVGDHLGVRPRLG
jgi:hypothetical protein